MMPAQQGTLNVVNDAVFVVLSLPSSVVPQADKNGDGLLSEDELHASMPLVLQRLRSGFQLRSGVNTPGAEKGQVVLVNPMAQPDEGTHFVVLMKFQFNHPPQVLELETDLFGTRATEQQLSLKATRGNAVDVAILRPSHATHPFFRSPLQVFGSYVATGVEHIVTGTDHVLFLVTIIVAGMGWRYWLAVLTSFTLAHSITLTLGLLGWVKVNPAIVEPAIAASIVLMAALNLKRHFSQVGTTHSAAQSTSQQASIVFFCGLLHGLGFASSMADMGLHGNYQLASLLGFNLGIELGQAACLVGVLVVLRLAAGAGQAVAHLKPRPALPALAAPGRWHLQAWLQAPVLASLWALSVGCYWVIQRLA